MNSYLVLLAAKSSISFDKAASQYVFQRSDIRISYRKIESNQDKTISGFSYGWFIEIILQEKTLESAISRAYDFSESFLSALSLESGVEMYKSKLILAFDNTEGRKDREYRQFFYDMPFSRPHKVNFEVFSNHLEAIWKFDDDTKERLYRSIRWFRKGVLEEDPLDQFLAFWQGLETLNPLLAEYYNCPKKGEKEIEKTCSRTGQTFYEEIMTDQGIVKLAEDLGMNQLMKKIKLIRNGISHGFKSFSSLYNDCNQASPSVGKLLHQGVIKVLGFTFDETVLKHISNIAPIKVGESQFIDLTLCNAELGELATEYMYPYVVLQHVVNDTLENGHEVESSFSLKIGCAVTLGALGASGRGVQMELKQFDQLTNNDGQAET